MPSRVFTLASLPSLPAAAVQAAEVARKSSWRIIRAQPMRAILLAKATAATLRSLLASSLTSQGSCLARLLMSTDIAPLTSKRRRYPLPRLLIGPSLTLPPVPSCRGTSPSEAEKSRPLRKAAGLTTIAAMALDRIGPIAGRGDQMPAGRVAAPPVHDLLVNALELSLEATQRLRHSSQSVLQQCWNPVLLGIGQDRRQFADVPRPG